MTRAQRRTLGAMEPGGGEWREPLVSVAPPKLHHTQGDVERFRCLLICHRGGLALIIYRILRLEVVLIPYLRAHQKMRSPDSSLFVMRYTAGALISGWFLPEEGDRIGV